MMLCEAAVKIARGGVIVPRSPHSRGLASRFELILAGNRGFNGRFGGAIDDFCLMAEVSKKC